MGNISSVLKAKRKELGLTLHRLPKNRRNRSYCAALGKWKILNRYGMNALPNWLTFSALHLLY